MQPEADPFDLSIGGRRIVMCCGDPYEDDLEPADPDTTPQPPRPVQGGDSCLFDPGVAERPCGTG
jgi:hypothetical protein